MAVEIKVPMLPESVADATMLHWHVNVGQPVRRDDNLVDIETEKVVLEVPAPRDGIITEIRRTEGDTVLADDVIALFEEQQGPTTTEAPPENEGAQQESPTEEPLPQAQPLEESPSPAANLAAPAGPAVRHLAAAEDIDLAEVQGTGRSGRILKTDIREHAKQPPSREAATEARGVRREPMSRLRQTIASR
ncbi:MAG: biotin/lipoyl-containing protein, partial [Pseudomonadota bacterium]|nr:biotin/lipoyl-containing protein [Pseudomonadota bacterium]